MSLFNTLPQRGAILHGDISNFFAGVSIEDGPSRLLELAKYYYYSNAMTWFVWGTLGTLKGTYSPKLQELIDDYNSMEIKRQEDISGYFALMWSGETWRVYYTPWDEEEPESIDIDITEKEALQIATEFVELGFIDLNKHLDRVYNFTLYLFLLEKYLEEKNRK